MTLDTVLSDEFSSDEYSLTTVVKCLLKISSILSFVCSSRNLLLFLVTNVKSSDNVSFSISVFLEYLSILSYFEAIGIISSNTCFL